MSTEDSQGLVIRIARWDELYEPRHYHGKPLQRSLPYTRWYTHGHQMGPGYRRLCRLAGPDAAGVFGVWGKLLELAADETAALRNGTVHNHLGKAASLDDIADETWFPVELIGKAVRILSDPKIGWLEVVGSCELLGVTGGNSEVVISDAPVQSRAPGLSQEQIPGAPVQTAYDKPRARAIPGAEPVTSTNPAQTGGLPQISKQRKETETEGKGMEHTNRGERSASLDTHGNGVPLPDSDSVHSRSGSSVSDSGEPSPELGTLQKATFQKLCLKLGVNRNTQQGSSDLTTFSRMVREIVTGHDARTKADTLYALAVDKAGSASLRNPRQAFTAAVKESFDWRGVSSRAGPDPLANGKGEPVHTSSG